MNIVLRRGSLIIFSVFVLLLLWSDFHIHFFIGSPQTVSLSQISALLGGCQTSVAPRRAAGERGEEEKGGGRDRGGGRERKRGRRKRGECQEPILLN